MVRTLSEENKQQILYEWMEANEDGKNDKVTPDGISVDCSPLSTGARMCWPLHQFSAKKFYWVYQLAFAV